MMSWDYIAGFFDGEGSICHNGKGFRICIPQTNEDVLNNIAGFCGFGKIAKITKRKKHWKDSWVYYISRQEEVLVFLRGVSGSLIVKRDLTQKTIKTLNTYFIKKEKKKRILEKKMTKARAMRVKGVSYRKIGEEINLDWGYTRRILIKRGIR